MIKWNNSSLENWMLATLFSKWHTGGQRDWASEELLVGKCCPLWHHKSSFFLKVVCLSTRYPSLMHTREVIKGLTFGYRTGKKRSTLTSSQTSWNVRRERKRDSEHQIRKWSHGQMWSALTACPPPQPEQRLLPWPFGPRWGTLSDRRWGSHPDRFSACSWSSHKTLKAA